LPAIHGVTRFQIAKVAIYATLIVNLVIFVLYGTRNEILENIGWLILLGVFEYETGQPGDDYDAAWKASLVKWAHVLAYALIVLALIGYVYDWDWLNCVNAILWLLVVAALAYDVYAPGAYGGVEWRIRNALKLTLYTGLAALAVWWGYTGSLLDFWDAALWIVCFLVVELNTLRDPAAAPIPSQKIAP
jgi:hypothetical protein